VYVVAAAFRHVVCTEELLSPGLPLCAKYRVAGVEWAFESVRRIECFYPPWTIFERKFR
jgi:hypothetical protein